MSPEVKTISLEAAASEIHQECEGLSDSKLLYFFLVGAGISKPPVKLASEIIDDCREVAKKYRRDIEPNDKSLVNAYSHWFKLAYPALNHRRGYLESLIRDRNISQANFRLAHLLLEKKITFQRTRTWKRSTDPRFEEKAARVLDLYGACPVDGVVVCFDEFGPISLQPYPGHCYAQRKRPWRQRATYTRRGGVGYFFGGYDVHADVLFGG